MMADTLEVALFLLEAYRRIFSDSNSPYSDATRLTWCWIFDISDSDLRYWQYRAREINTDTDAIGSGITQLSDNMRLYYTSGPGSREYYSGESQGPSPQSLADYLGNLGKINWREIATYFICAALLGK